MTRTRHQTLGTYTESLSMITILRYSGTLSEEWRSEASKNNSPTKFNWKTFCFSSIPAHGSASELSPFNWSTEYLTVFCFELVNVANQFEARNTTFKSNRFLLNILPFLSKDIFTESMSKRICETKVNFLFFNFSKTVFPHREF